MITGAAGALGRAVFAHFEALGDQLIALDISAVVLEKVFSGKGPHLYVPVDLTSRTSCEQALSETGAAGVDVLCNLAGGFMMGEAVHETTDATWDFLFNLNTRSIVNVSAVVVPGMLASGGGKIVNVAARAATAGAASMGAYTASKAAVMRLTESMALELRDRNINVNCIMPGIIDTERNRADMPDADPSRWVPPRQLASVIGFLASDAAIAVHGAAIPVDGLS